MKRLRIFNIIVLLILITSTNEIRAIELEKVPIKVGVLLYREDDYYISSLKNDLLKIENENKYNVDFIFYDGKGSQELQDKQIEELINSKVDLILLDLVDVKKSCFPINISKENNIPIIFFHREPSSMDCIKSYGKSLYIGTEACDSGNIQGQMIINEWKNKNIIDKNYDNIIDYVLLKGEKENLDAQARSRCVIKTIKDNGIRINEIASEYCNWEKECARIKMEELISRHGDTIELIISNNDEMAIGAIMALQEMGYNKGDSGKHISVVGIDGTEEAKKLIQNGSMTGTVIQESEGMAKALYTIGMNFVQGKEPLKDTEYKFDRTGVRVMIPYGNYITRSSLKS
jgi:methyl-galactoside transport system substrate-binding protein